MPLASLALQVSLAVAVGALALAVVGWWAAAWVRRSLRAAGRSAAVSASRATRLETELGAREAVLSATEDGVALFDAEGALVYANPAARDLLGRRFTDLRELWPSELRQAALDARSSGDPVALETPTAGRDLQVTAVPSETAGAVVVLARDVTAERRVERVRRDFVANASHELKTPVASILALAETLRHAIGMDPDAVERFMELLEQEAARLSKLVDDLLDLSRLETARLPDDIVELDRVIHEETDRVARRAEVAGIRLVLEPAAPAKVRGSAADLGLLVFNLLDNAIRYNRTGGEVRVSLAARDGAVELRISDTGIGISGADLPRVFERFYRADPARSRETGGTGLGLAIVRHVAESHGGEVRVESVLGAGSTFVVLLPLSG